MSGRLGREPTPAEIAEVTGIEPEEVYSIKRSGPTGRDAPRLSIGAVVDVQHLGCRHFANRTVLA